MIRTPVCDLLGIDYPLFQGGMAYLGTGELAGAVSEAGGLGIVGAGNSPPEWVKGEIDKVRRLTNKPFGVNVMLLSPYAAAMVDLVLAERVPVVTTGAGNPGPYMARLKEAGIKVIPVVPAAVLAKRMEKAGADAVIAEGMESGGHIGEMTTFALLPQVVDAVRIPVIAAGGIADGRGMAAAFALGARAVQMGTRFVCATECIAHPAYKRAIIEAGDRDTVVGGKTTGHPVRALKNRFTREFERLELSGAGAEELDKFGAGRYRAACIDGDVEWGSVLSGQIAGLVREEIPAAEIVKRVMSEAEAVIHRLGELPCGR
ncbi:MAG: enoyl-[acyl-carrier-protein] reductase FabK [Firmicutes bacterium]|nr:enoyl-[acyl-carrier-protein] reductase FabK [Bacillota bacterium]